MKKNTLNRAIINRCWNKPKNANRTNVCNYEPIWIITWTFSMYYGLAKWTQFIFKQHLQRYPYIKCKRCTPCTSVSAWALKLPPSQKNRHLGTCVLEYYVDYGQYHARSTSPIVICSWIIILHSSIQNFQYFDYQLYLRIIHH